MKSVKKILMVFLLANVIVFTLTGCFQRQNVVAVINDIKITEPLYRIFLWQTQQGMESVDPNIWKMDNFGGKSPQEIAKERALNSICYYVMAKEKADELGIKLGKEEKNAVKKAAKKAAVENEKINQKYGIKQSDYETFYSYVKIKDRVLEVMGESYEPNQEELSNALADEATIVQVFINTKNEQGNDIPDDKKQQAYDEANEVLKKALAGESLLDLAISYSDDESVKDNKGVYSFKRGQLDPALEEVVFEKAELNKVYPEVVETANGYEILEVTEIKKEGSSEAKEEAIKQLKAEYAANELLGLTKFADTQLKEGYDSIQLMSMDTDQ